MQVLPFNRISEVSAVFVFLFFVFFLIPRNWMPVDHFGRGQMSTAFNQTRQGK